MGKDLPDLVKWAEAQDQALINLIQALQTQAGSEPGHLEALSIHEKNMAKEDDDDLNEEEMAAIMQAHKDASPFGADVAVAKAKWLKVMKK